MNLLRKLFFGSLIFLSFLVVTSTTSLAAPRPLTDLNYFHWANQHSTPAENTFIMKYGEKTSVDFLEGIGSEGYLRVNGTSLKSSALVRNVSYYKGQSVNVKITLDNSKKTKGGYISFSKSRFMTIDIDGETKVTYEFQNQQGEPMTVETAFNYYGLNTNKYIGYLSPGHVIKGIYANNPTHVLYDIWDGGKDNYWLYLQNITAGIPWEDPRQDVEVTTKPITSLTMVAHNTDSTTSTIGYRTDFLAKPEFPPAYAEDSSFQKADEGVYLKANQTIPNIGQWKKASSMNVRFKLDQVHQMNQYQLGEVKVTDFSGTDLSDLFDSKLTAGGNILLAAKDPADARLYDTVLQYYVYLKRQGNQQPVATSLISNGQLVMPFQVQTELNGKELAETAAATSVNYLSKLTVKFLDEQDNEVHPSITKEGILTTTYDVSDAYPNEDGYYPMRNETTDRGRFLSEEQTVVHRYRKGQPPLFELKNKENPLLLSRFTKQRPLAFQVTHEANQPFTLLAKRGQEEQVLQQYPAAPATFEDVQMFQAPADWLNREVSFFIRDEQNQTSSVETRVLKLEAQPQLLLPDRVTFSEQQIPTMNKEVAADTQSPMEISDSSQLDRSIWTISVRQEQPLTSEAGNQLTDHLIFLSQGQKVTVNAVDQPILRGSGNTKINLAEHLKLTLHPSDETGKYQGKLIWNLMDAPR